VLVLDDVNTGFANVAYERSEIDKFLRTDGGQLAHPMALAFLTDDGIKVQDEFSSDGNELSAGLDKSSLGLHSIRRSGGIYSAVERLQISMKALFELGTREAARPELKGLAWIDTENSQVVAMESDMLRPAPEIQLLRDHQLIDTTVCVSGTSPWKCGCPRAPTGTVPCTATAFTAATSSADSCSFRLTTNKKLARQSNQPRPTAPNSEW